jgi:hypothetical protein
MNVFYVAITIFSCIAYSAHGAQQPCLTLMSTLEPDKESSIDFIKSILSQKNPLIKSRLLIENAQIAEYFQRQHLRRLLCQEQTANILMPQSDYSTASIDSTTDSEKTNAQESCLAIVLHKKDYKKHDKKNFFCFRSVNTKISQKALKQFQELEIVKYFTEDKVPVFLSYKPITDPFPLIEKPTPYKQYFKIAIPYKKLFRHCLYYFYKKSNDNLLESTISFLKCFKLNPKGSFEVSGSSAFYSNLKDSFKVCDFSALYSSPYIIQEHLIVNPSAAIFNENRLHLKYKRWAGSKKPIHSEFYFYGEETPRDRENKKFCIRAGCLGLNALGLYALYKTASWGFLS